MRLLQTIDAARRRLEGVRRGRPGFRRFGEARSHPIQQQQPRQYTRQYARGLAQTGATMRDDNNPGTLRLDSRNSLIDTDLRDATRISAASDKKATSETRTPDLSFTKARGDSESSFKPESYDQGSSGTGSRPGNIKETSPIDKDLHRLIEVWPKITEPVRAGVLAMVEAVMLD